MNLGVSMLRNRCAAAASRINIQSSNYVANTAKKRGQYLTKCQAIFREFFTRFRGSA